METLAQDLAYSIRSLRRSPGFTVVVVLTLALGVGANTAIFSVLNAVLLRPLPFVDPGRVVHLAWDGNGHLQELSAAKFQYWRDHARSFQSMATWRSSFEPIDVAGQVRTARVLAVTDEFFGVVGHSAALGRVFLPGESAPGRTSAAIISHAIWRTQLGGADSVLGRTIRLNGEIVEIVGVLPDSFAFAYDDDPVDVIVPLRLTVNAADVAENWPTIARLREHVTHEQAQAEVTSLIGAFRAEYPSQVSERDRGMTLATFTELYVDARVRRALWMLMGAVTIVLLIACANVANLFLARVTERRREIAVRAALGASQSRVIRLILTESALVAIAAGAVGLLSGMWVARVLVALTPTEIPRLATLGIDWRVMLFAVLAALVTVLLFGGGAAWPAARAHLSEVLKQTTRVSFSAGRLRQGLLVAQSALSMVLLIGAALLVRTLIALTSVGAGFAVEDLIAIRFQSKPAGYDTSRDFWEVEQRILHAFRDSPTVSSVAGASSLPFERGLNTPITIRGRSDKPGSVEWRAVTPHYFQTLGIPLVSGRVFTDADIAAGPPVAIINEAFARRYFPGADPIGQHIEAGGSRRELNEIVGVVADIREVSPRTDPRRTMYVPQAQAPDRLSNWFGTLPVLLARVRVPGSNVERQIGQAIQAVDPALPVPHVFPLEDAMRRTLARERFGASLLSVLAVLAAVLTAIGIHGVLAYTVKQRRREISIRVALGARVRQVTRPVIVQGMVPVLIGTLAGVGASIGLSGTIAGFLWGVAPTDTRTLVGVAAILMIVALGASWIPARRAARVDPASALKAE
jgi:putative ABC transport system permease protein